MKIGPQTLTIKEINHLFRCGVYDEDECRSMALELLEYFAMETFNIKDLCESVQFKILRPEDIKPIVESLRLTPQKLEAIKRSYITTPSFS